MSSTRSVDPEEDEDRWARYRANYIGRQTPLREIECLALAYSELGYSRSGVAKKIDVAEGTVKSYYKAIAAKLGREALEPKYPENQRIDADLPEVHPDRVAPPPSDRLCPHCGEQRVVNPANVSRIFPDAGRKLKRAANAAERDGAPGVCTNCYESVDPLASEREEVAVDD